MATAGVPDPKSEDAGLAAGALDHDAVGHGSGQGEAGTTAQGPSEGEGDLAGRSGSPDRHLTEVTRGAVDHEVPLVGREMRIPADFVHPFRSISYTHSGVFVH